MLADAKLPSGRAITFGPFCLLPMQQLLLEEGKPVRLGARALDILVALAQHAGELVRKEELVAAVWPDTFVEEGNLRVHVAALRRALGDGRGGRRYIANVPGQGYRFVAPVAVSETPADASPEPIPPSAGPKPGHNLPAPITRIVGRADVVASLVSQVPVRRLITLVGPGGIGKTTVALAAAEALSGAYADGVRFVELAALADPRLAATAVASTLGLPVRSEDALGDVARFLRDRQLLLVLDSCEHMIDAVAVLAEAISKAAPHVHTLATSREPLRADGERVLRLPPLGLPSASPGLAAADALGFPAVQLFVERAAATLDTFELSDAEAPLVGEICLRLDGNPLAIELAAGRIDAFGVRGLAERLDDRFRLLVRGRRTALPRHKTLAATLDWSYELLPEAERVMLRRLAIFTGAFDLAAANSVVAGVDFSTSDVVELVAELVAKSLVSADVGGATVLYRLLDTTKAYAHERLKESGEFDGLARRHAEHCRVLFERAERERERMSAADWLASYARSIDDIRAALDWAYSDAGDKALGVSLTVAALPLWWQLSLIDESRRRVEQALAACEAEPTRSDRRELQLNAALGWSLMYTKVPDRETGAAWVKALTLAEALDDTDYRLRALWGLWAGHQNNGEFVAALALARQFSSIAARSTNPADQLIGDRMTGAALHFLGDQSGARQHIERMLAHYVTPEHGADIVRFQFDQRVTATITLARILWLQGLGVQAMQAVEHGIAHAMSIGHTLSLCNLLAQAACPVALLSGDPAADRYIALLLRNTGSHGVEVWRVYCDGFNGQRLIASGDLDSGLSLLRSAVNDLRRARFVQYHTAFLGSLAEGLAAAGQEPQALAAIEEALTRSARTDERWCLPELLRIKGEVTLRSSKPQAAADAEDHFRRSNALAGEQGAIAWELRSAMSLARLLQDRGRADEAQQALAAAYGRFTEGFDTADLRAARSLLEELS